MYLVSKKDCIAHHGIKGQKWGVRRYRNRDGTLTEAGKRRAYYRNRVVRELSYVDDVNQIARSLPAEDKRLLGMSSNEREWIDKDNVTDIVSNIAKTFIEYHGQVPVSFLEIWETRDGVGEISVATDPRYRGSGVTSKNIQNAIKWFESKRNTRINELQWNNLTENQKSADVAERYGFNTIKTDNERQYRSRFK